jgi:hypothetical protein
MQNFRELIYNQHDVVCNQKYGDGLPYSFHLKAVEAQGNKFIHLILDEYIENPRNRFSKSVSLRDIVRSGLVAHDVIEDGRFTYNNVREKVDLGNHIANGMVAEIVYCVTDLKGRSRETRKNEQYYSELRANRLAVFVKLADVAANTLFSKLTNSSMYLKYKSEFPHFKEELYCEEYKEFFDYIESL